MRHKKQESCVNSIDWTIIAIAAFGFVLWMRGCAKVSASDCLLGGILGLAASAASFFPA